MLRKTATVLLLCASFLISTLVVAKGHQEAGWNLVTGLAGFTAILSLVGIFAAIMMED